MFDKTKSEKKDEINFLQEVYRLNYKVDIYKVRRVNTCVQDT